MRSLALLASLAALGSLAALLACDKSAPHPNLLFVSIDTLRADHLGCYGYPRKTSPNLDAFAAKSVVFDEAQSASSWTLPSLASLMTSLQQSTHRCEKDSSRLDPSYTTLAEVLRDAGYDTAFVASHLFLNAGHGLQQGFTHVDTRILQDEMAITSPAVTDWGVRWLEDKAAARDGTPWFLWLHYFDPHAPYLVHEGISDAFGTETDVDRYDGEIAFTDGHVGRLFDTFERLGFAENTIVVVVADHGEAFGEHGKPGHGYDLHQEVVRVPLILRAPGLRPGRVREVVPTVDVMPTLLALCGTSARNEIAGRRLFDGAQAFTGSSEAVSEVRWQFEQDMKSLRRGSWKYVDNRRGEKAWRELYDHAADSGETTDLSAGRADVASEMQHDLGARLGKAAALAALYERLETSDLPPGEIERLKALGYAGDK